MKIANASQFFKKESKVSAVRKKTRCFQHYFDSPFLENLFKKWHFSYNWCNFLDFQIYFEIWILLIVIVSQNKAKISFNVVENSAEKSAALLLESASGSALFFQKVSVSGSAFLFWQVSASASAFAILKSVLMLWSKAWTTI